MSKVGAVPDDLERYGVLAVGADDDVKNRHAEVRGAVERLRREGVSVPYFDLDIRLKNYVDECRATDLEVIRVADAFRKADANHTGYVKVNASKLESALKKITTDPSITERAKRWKPIWPAMNPSAGDIAARFGVHFNSLAEWQQMTGGNCDEIVYGIDGKAVLTGTGYVVGPTDGRRYPLVNPNPNRPETWQTIATSDVEVVTIGETGSNVATARLFLSAIGLNVDATPPMNAEFYSTHFGFNVDGMPYSTGNDSPVAFTPAMPSAAENRGQGDASGFENLAAGWSAFVGTKNADLFGTRVVYQEDAQHHTRAFIEAVQAFDMGDTIAFLTFAVAFSPTGFPYLDGFRLTKTEKNKTGSSDSYVLRTQPS